VILRWTARHNPSYRARISPDVASMARNREALGGRCGEGGFPRPRPAHLSKEDSCARMRRVGKGPLPIESVRLALDGG